MSTLLADRPWRLGIVGLLWLVLVPHAHAQQTPPDTLRAPVIEARVDQERIMVGDPIAYTIRVESPPGVEVTWPGPQSDLDPFEVLSFSHEGPYALDNGGFADTLRYSLTVYSAGVHAIPPILIPYTRQDGTQRTAVADSIPITVVSVINDEAKDIRDLKQPLDVPDSIPWYVWAGGATLLAALIIGGIYLYRRRNRKDMAEEPELAPPRLPHEIAYDELDQLARCQWLAQGRVTQHYTSLSEIIRRYLAARYHTTALEITTTELIDYLSRLDIKAEYRRQIADFLHECDLVKFARYIPDAERQGRSIRDAREIVAATKVLPDPVVEPAPPVISSPTTNA